MVAIPRYRSATRPSLTAGLGIETIYVLITLAALLRLLSPFASKQMDLALSPAGAAWSGAFGFFVILDGGPVARSRVQDGVVRLI